MVLLRYLTILNVENLSKFRCKQYTQNKTILLWSQLSIQDTERAKKMTAIFVMEEGSSPFQK